MKNTAVLFGGNSAEHEVSVITALQVLENIDCKKFRPHAIRLSKDGLFEYLPSLRNKSQYFKIKPQIVIFGSDSKGSYFQVSGLLKRKNYIDVAYLAFHGGDGEGGHAKG